MAISQRLDMRQSQSLVMTPQLQQAIKLLQLSNIELAEFVEAEIERNPLLEHGEGTERDDTEGSRTGSSPGRPIWPKRPSGAPFQDGTAAEAARQPGANAA